MHFPSCILHYRHRISSNTCFNRARGRQENEGSIRLMLKLTYHTARLEVRGITCTHDDDVMTLMIGILKQRFFGIC